METDILEKTIGELFSDLINKRITSEDIIRACYQNIERFGSETNAFIYIVPETVALARARESDRCGYSKERPLQGIPYVLKDTYLAKEIPTTAASKALDNFVSPYSATLVKRLEKAGSILIGKTNMDAWGHGASSENTDYGPVRNPWDLSRVAGGSSGGCGAAVSARMAVFAIGEDTGGSIRNPSAWCNITGLKVTYGRVSRYGCIAYASSLDTMGPMAKSAADCAYVMEIIAGKDRYDATSSSISVPSYTKKLTEKIEKVRLGIPKELLSNGLDPQIKEAVLNAVEEYKKMGVEVCEISMPLLSFGVALYYIVAPSETSSNMARYDGIRYGGSRDLFTEETKRRIITGTYVLSSGYYDAYYKKAQQARVLLAEEYKQAFSKCDILVMPVTATPPVKIGELTSNPLASYLIDIYTVTHNPVGIPAIAIPCGFTGSQLPIGVQLTGDKFTEPLLLRLAYQYQQITDWHKRKPKILTDVK